MTAVHTQCDDDQLCWLTDYALMTNNTPTGNDYDMVNGPKNKGKQTACIHFLPLCSPGIHELLRENNNNIITTTTHDVV